MTYSLNTLNADRAAAAPSGFGRFAQEIALVLGAAALAFWLLAMLSHSPADPAWSTTGARPDAHNWGGRLGALVSDGGYYMLGWSVWWCFFAGLRAWLSTLAVRLRSQPVPEIPSSHGTAQRWWQSRVARRAGFALALVVLLDRKSVV